jgi:hypothetical protein
VADEIELPRGFGRRNVHCSNCGDERGGPFGHETAECHYRDGMSVGELVDLPHLVDRRPEVWEHYVERYLEEKLARRPRGTVRVDVLGEWPMDPTQREATGG